MRDNKDSTLKLERRLAVASAVAIAAALAAPPAHAQEATQRFNIPAQPLGRALLDLGRQARISIAAPRSMVAGRTSSAISGEMTLRDALTRMLNGSGLRFEFVNGGAVRIVAASSAQASTDQVFATEAIADESPASEPDIIVTATKREERLRDLPTAATVLSGDRIATAGIQDFRDYASLVPGLSQRDFGSPGQGTIILRGLNTGPQQTTNTAAYYLDDALFTASGFVAVGAFFTPSPDLGDVERIEVLKGPQGTLYGANSLGGLIRVISRPPDADEFSGSLRGEISDTDGGDIGYSGRGVVNIPLIDGRLAVRASGAYRRIGGFTDNVGIGRDNVNDADIYGGRIALRYQPVDDLTIDLVAYLQNIDSAGAAVMAHVPGTLIPRFGRYAFSGPLDGLTSDIRYRLYTGSVNYDLGPLSWITTVGYTEISSDNDSDSTAFFAPLLPTLAPSAPPGTAFRTNSSPNTDKWTVESRLVSERIGPFEFIVGGYYTTEQSEQRTLLLLVNPATGAPLAAPLGTLFRAATLSDYEEIAGFGNLTFYLSDRIDFTGGIRYAHNRNISTTGAPLDGLPSINFFAPRSPRVFRSSENPATYLATLRWRPTDQISTYLRAASGYRPGGPQTNPNPPPLAPTEVTSDRVWNYEAGIRASFLRNTLALEASVYHIDWSDIQLNTLFGGTILTGNGGQAEVDGFELALSARPSRYLTIAGSLGYTNARITEIAPGVTASIGAASGDRFPLTPDWTASVLADQRIPLSDTVEATIGGTLRFQSEMPSSYPGAPTDPNIKIPGFATLDLRGGVSFGHYSVQLRAENLLNQLGYTSASASRLFPTQNISTIGTVIRPRTITLSLTAQF